MRASTTRSSQAGYTLVALMVGIAILTIVVAAVGPMVGTIMKREREQELIFRGRQYARAIAIFQRRFGRLPNQLKELSENRPRSIRKLWREPMCNCDRWHLLIQNTPEAVPATLPTGLGPPGGGPVPPGQPAGPGPTSGSPNPTPTPSAMFTPLGGIFGQGTNAPVGPIVGVRSELHKEALNEWRGLKYYDQWRFIVGDADRDTTSTFDPNSLSVQPRLTPGPR
jgi:type II secretory pathway pseudopilin PulG